MGKHYCTNCSTPLTLAGECPQCKQINTLYDFKKCAFTHEGKQCPAAGSISQGTKGEGRFFCAAHYRTRDNKTESINILNEYLLHGVPTKKDWRDELMEKYINGE